MNTQDFKFKIADIIGPTRKRKKPTARGPKDRGYYPPSKKRRQRPLKATTDGAPEHENQIYHGLKEPAK